MRTSFPTISFSGVLVSALMLSSFTAVASANEGHQRSSASSHAPIGVMGDHMHNQGEYMLSYRYMRMDMDGNRVGKQRVTPRDVVGTGANPGQFLVVPTRMPMNMHMVGGMYGLSDNITLLAMVSYLDNSMDHLLRNGRQFTTESSGFGDTKVGALFRLTKTENQNMHIGVKLSLPTGSTTERDDTPAMRNAFLPYPMQLGSGTYDIMPSVTYDVTFGSIKWGAQASAVIRTGENDEQYTLGNRRALTSWLSKDLSHNLSVSARFNFQDWDAIDGANPVLNPRMIQTANPELQAGQRLDFSLGVNYFFNSGHRVALEYAQAIEQDLDGPQLETDSVFTIGWQKAF